MTLLVLCNPAARYLARLEHLPDDVRIVAGERFEMFEEAAPEADAIFVGLGYGALLERIWPLAKRVRWVHSFSAGIDKLLFPALVESPVPLTNARGVFARSLGEFAIGAMMFFAKDFRRMLRSQAEHRWDPFDVTELHGHVLGIAGYGEIGRAAATRAHALGMRVIAVRRHPERSLEEECLDLVLPMAGLPEMLGEADYLLAAAPLTAETKGWIGAKELRMMKRTAVLINLGRGPVIVEEALVEALEQGIIRGAALDVFDTEPLPAGHPFYRLDNVLLSPHCADHTPGWQEMAMDKFIENFRRFREGRVLLNVVDKQLGY